MTFPSIQSHRQEIFNDLQACRNRTLEIFTDLDAKSFCQQAHPDFSPIGWHLGHIAFIEAYWILETCAGLPPLYSRFKTLFAADGLPKSERQNLPAPEVIYDYLQTVRTRVLTYLQTAPIEKQERLWRWSIQHESQHGETIAFIRQLQRWDGYARLNFPNSKTPIGKPQSDDAIQIPAGEFVMGNDRIDAQDNERSAHRVYLNTYWIDRYPVTCDRYREFITAGGYQNERYWSQQGWQWLQENPVSYPLYWSDSPDWDSHPVCGVSWYEAEAYARYVGKRLPTEAEWEKAASWDEQNQCQRLYPWGNNKPNAKLCNHDSLVGHTTPVYAYTDGQTAYGCYDMLGNVWEWTSSWFARYEKFVPYPYRGYSQTYFDGKHRVLRGGSWATRSWAMRSSFRNWYHPGVRQILAGFRCASDG